MRVHEYRLGFRADVEGLRALAILLVVAVHAGVPWLGGGFVGVDVFFVLSGFLITGLLVKEASATGRLRFAAFYVRRLRRLLPALFVMLLVTAVLAMLLLAPGEQRGQAPAAALAAMWLSNIHFALAQLDYFAAGTETNLYLHTWSLGVEEQFYLIWPALLVWLLGHDGERGMARLRLGMMCVAGVSLVACVWLTYAAPRLAFYMMPMRAWQFAAGALVWLYFVEPGKAGMPRLPLRHSRALGWAGLASVLLAAIWLGPQRPYPGVWAMLPTLGAACVVMAGCAAGEHGGVSRALAWRPLQWLGGISYSWYLWHWPVLLLGHALVGSQAPAWRAFWVLFSLALAWLSYRWVESPVRWQPRWLVRPGATLLGALVLMVLCFSLGMRWFNLADTEARAPAAQRYAKAHGDAPVIYAMGCDDWYHSDRVRACAFGSADAPHTAVLMGDSHAGQWFPAVAQAFNRPGWRLLVFTKSSCPMVDEPFFYARIGKEYTVCATWRERALAEVARLHPDVVLLGTVDSNGFSRTGWVEGTARVLGVLSPAAGHVYLLRDTPALPFDGPDCLEQLAGRPAWLRLGRTCAASAYSARGDEVATWQGEAAQRFANARVLDMNSWVCPHGICMAEQNGLVVFRDTQHLTGSFAASLGSALAAQLGLDAAKGAAPSEAEAPSFVPEKP